ncbi:MAG: hypothetical protein K0U66_11185 [Gammaproteobacteria bacterium]|nr:hypothetical protein [Gammaproteobacteria bacterium]
MSFSAPASLPQRHSLAGYLRALVPIAVAALLTSCATGGKTIALNPQTGYFTGEKVKHGLPDTARVVRTRPFDIDSARAVIVVPDDIEMYRSGSETIDFTLNAIRDIGYFGEVITVSQLLARVTELGIQSDDLATAASTGDEPGMIQAIAVAWRPFLWLRWDYRQGSDRVGDEHHQLVLTQAITLDDVFIVETPYLYTSDGGYYSTSPRVYFNVGYGAHYGYGYGRSYYSPGYYGHHRGFSRYVRGNRWHGHGHKKHRKHHNYSRGYHSSRVYLGFYPYAGFYPGTTTVYVNSDTVRTTSLKKNHYPMLNELIDYIKAQSNTWPARSVPAPTIDSSQPTPAHEEDI